MKTGIKMILFDLDGTLLPMDMKVFTEGYFKFLVAKFLPYGYDPKELINGVWAGTAAMAKNDGTKTNEEAFWKKFAEVCGERVISHKYLFEDFYANEFGRAKNFCGFNAKAAETVSYVKEKGFRTALATSPIFPVPATELRIGWAGCSPDDFELYTTYENCRFCKPNPQYYIETAGKLNVGTEECLMVGNDVDEDIVAASAAGMSVFLLTDTMVNGSGRDISEYPRGDFDDLKKYIDEL